MAENPISLRQFDRTILKRKLLFFDLEYFIKKFEKNIQLILKGNYNVPFLVQNVKNTYVISVTLVLSVKPVRELSQRKLLQA